MKKTPEQRWADVQPALAALCDQLARDLEWMHPHPYERTCWPLPRLEVPATPKALRAYADELAGELTEQGCNQSATWWDAMMRCPHLPLDRMGEAHHLLVSWYRIIDAASRYVPGQRCNPTYPATMDSFTHAARQLRANPQPRCRCGRIVETPGDGDPAEWCGICTLRREREQWAQGRVPVFDERDQKIVNQRAELRDKIDGPRIGDWVIFRDATARRIAYHWGDGVQTTDGGSFHLDQGGGMSMSGSLHPSVSTETLTRAAETRDCAAWIFHHDLWQAHNGVSFTLPCRVFTCTENPPR